MTTLADRLDQARALHGTVTPATPSVGGVAKRRGGDPFAPVKERVHQSLVESLGPRLYDPHLSESELAAQVRATLQQVIGSEQTPLSHADRTNIAQDVSDDILGHGPLEPLLRDPDVTEIMVNGPNDIYIERDGRLYRVDARFSGDVHLRRTIDKIVSRVGRRVDESSPMVDARLPDGARVNVVIPPMALDGAILTIRQFAADPFSADDLVNFGTMTPTVRDFLAACVRGRLNIVISGGTGSGKTTMLNVLSLVHPRDERIVTIEDAAELQLHQDHVRPPGGPPGQHRGQWARSRSATWCATPCGCAPTGSSSARSAAARPWTCCRR